MQNTWNGLFMHTKLLQKEKSFRLYMLRLSPRWVSDDWFFTVSQIQVQIFGMNLR